MMMRATIIPPDLTDDEHDNHPSTVAKVTAVQSDLPPYIVLIDSGATHLVTPRMSDLVDPVPSPVTTIAGIGGAKKVQLMQGSIQLCGHWFHNALCVPQALNVLVPINVILKLFGGDVAMPTINCRHFAPGGIITVLGPCIKDGLYSLETLPSQQLIKRERLMRLHVKLGHASKAKMRIMLSRQPMDGLLPKDLALWIDCAFCAEANTTAVPHPNTAIVLTTFYGQRIDWDMTGPQVVRTPGGAFAALLGID